jgi:hypothetical protein
MEKHVNTKLQRGYKFDSGDDYEPKPSASKKPRLNDD